MTDDLITWLRGQLDHDERVAEETDWADVYRDPMAAKRRFLAEIDAKRRIIDHVAPIADGTGGWRWFQGSESEAEAVIKLLALPYADHEGYRDEWRP